MLKEDCTYFKPFVWFLCGFTNTLLLLLQIWLSLWFCLLCKGFSVWSVLHRILFLLLCVMWEKCCNCLNIMRFRVICLCCYKVKQNVLRISLDVTVNDLAIFGKGSKIVQIIWSLYVWVILVFFSPNNVITVKFQISLLNVVYIHWPSELPQKWKPI